MDIKKYEGWSAAFIGRFNCIHLGHEVVTNEMINDFGFERSRLFIGSANNTQSLRHFFSYEERRDFIKTIWPQIKVMPIGDTISNAEWLLALDDLLISSGMDPQKTVFFGGCEEDIIFFLEQKREYYIVNRFDGSTPKISATEVRDCLVHERPLEGLLNPLIQEKVQTLFKKKWIEFQKK